MNNAKDRMINRRQDEPNNACGYQVTFRTSEALSGAWSSLRGLCRRFGHDESSAELFREVVVPAMQSYVSRMGYVDAAREGRAKISGKLESNGDKDEHHGDGTGNTHNERSLQ